jgi:hypothetical protein
MKLVGSHHSLGLAIDEGCFRSEEWVVMASLILDDHAYGIINSKRWW